MSKLSFLKLPPIQFAYDIGCFHLLNSDQIEGYIAGINEVIVSGGLFLLNAFTPREQGRKIVGFDSENIKDLFNPSFELERVTNHSYWRFPANWYWLRKKKIKIKETLMVDSARFFQWKKCRFSLPDFSSIKYGVTYSTSIC